MAARHDKIDPTVRVRVNLGFECLGEECCSSEKDEKFWDVDEHLRHSDKDATFDHQESRCTPYSLGDVSPFPG